MKSKERLLWVLLFICALWLPSLAPSHGQQEASADDALELKALIDKQIKAQNEEKLARYMQTIYPDSSVYKQTQNGTKELFNLYDLATTLRSFRYIGRDKTYAVVRVATETRKLIGPEFKDNLIDVIQIMKKHENQWKIYRTAIVGYRRLKSKPKKKVSGSDLKRNEERHSQ